MDEEDWPIAGGVTSVRQLWELNNLCFVPWLLFCVAPRWKHTSTACFLIPMLYMVTYSAAMIALYKGPREENPMAKFTNFDALGEGFHANQYFLYAGWIHFLSVDVVVGRLMHMESVARGD